MKRSARYQLNFASRWLTFSGVMMGLAFFLQALDYFALRKLSDVPVLELVLYLILPMVLEALWCVPLRSECWRRAEPHGIFAALLCLALMGQAILSGGVIPGILAGIFLVLSGAVAVLITWGVFPRRALGMLVFAATAAVWVLLLVLPQYGGYRTLLQLLPPVCQILGMMLLFGGIRRCRSED